MTRNALIHSITFLTLTPLCLLAGGGGGSIHPAYAAKGPPVALAAPPVDSTAPHTPVQALYHALQIAQTSDTTAAKRTAIIAPAVDQAFDLDTILERSLGKSAYGQIAPDEQAQLMAAFRKFTIANYVSTFKPGTDAVFKITPTPTPQPDPANGVIIHTTLSGKHDTDSTPLDYVMQRKGQGWRVVDILLNGTISQVAAQHEDFSSTVKAPNGVQKLIQALNEKSDGFVKD